MSCLANITTPQLRRIHSGKVRESFRIDDDTRMIVATDRISSFDSVLKSLVPDKGAILNSLSEYWFAETSDIVESHFVEAIDPNISLVREAVPIRVEMIVRGHLSGRMWRHYPKGKRDFYGVEVHDGWRKNQRFAQPIVTPTTKEESDREITPKGIVEEKLVDGAVYEQMAQISVLLFQRGQALLSEKNLILVDTKYEFGLVDGKLVLIDEIHTPDSSRFWGAADYGKDPENAMQMDKEYVRAHLLENKKGADFPEILPDEVVAETSRRYLGLYEMITGKKLARDSEEMHDRICRNLVEKNLIKDGYVAIVMGSPTDIDHCETIARTIEEYGIGVVKRVVSAHKNGEDIPALAEEYNESIEPGAVIAVAGLSNGLGGALAANLALPVFNCPPFKNQFDMQTNINSSLMMPSNVPASTILNPTSAALAAMRSLNLRRLRKRFAAGIEEMKENLHKADREVRGR